MDPQTESDEEEEEGQGRRSEGESEIYDVKVRAVRRSAGTVYAKDQGSGRGAIEKVSSTEDFSSNNFDKSDHNSFVNSKKNHGAVNNKGTLSRGIVTANLTMREAKLMKGSSCAVNPVAQKSIVFRKDNEDCLVVC